MKIYQIYYDNASKEKLDPGFIPIDNTSNARSDWREYWPIRDYLLNNTINDEDYYGFLSPKFSEKSGLNASDVQYVVQKNQSDVVSFSPFFDQMAYFLNPFIQGDITHPGLLKCSQEFLHLNNIHIPLHKLVCDHTTSIFCNYFVARGKVWKKWFYYSEQIYNLCEAQQHLNLSKELNAIVPYKEGEKVAMKVFLIERLITLILATEHYSRSTCNTLSLPYASHLLLPQHRRLVECDALKQAYIHTKNTFFLDFFYEKINAIGTSLKKIIELKNHLNDKH